MPILIEHYINTIELSINKPNRAAHDRNTLRARRRVDRGPRRRGRGSRRRVPPRRRPRLRAAQPVRGLPRRQPDLDERRLRRLRDRVRAELLADRDLNGRRDRRRHPGRAAHRDRRAPHGHQHDRLQWRVLRHPRSFHRFRPGAGHRARIRGGDGVDERRRDRRGRAPLARHSGKRHRARRRVRRGGRADGDGGALRPRHHRRHPEGRGPRRRRVDDHRRVRVRRRLRSERFGRRIRAGRVLADLGAVGGAVRGRTDLLRADHRRLHPAHLVNPVQRQADLHAHSASECSSACCCRACSAHSPR